MADALVIALRLDGLNPVMGGLNQVANRLQNVGSAGSRVSSASGPFGRLAMLQGGNAGAFAGLDAQVRLLRAQQQAMRAQNLINGGPGFAQRLQNFAYSSRFGAGGIMPLAGRTLDLFGLGKMAGPIGIAVAAVAALGMAAKMAADNLTSVSRARWAGGGTLADAVKARGLGALLGMDAGTVAGMANSLAQRLGSGGIPAAYANKLGIKDPLGATPFGKLDRFQNLFKMANAIANAPSDQAAMRMARMLGPEAEAMLPIRDASPSVRKQLLEMQANAFTPARVRAAADFNAQLEMLKLNLMDAAIALTPVIKIFNRILNFFNQGAQHPMELNKPTPAQAAARLRANAENRHRAAIDANTDGLNRLRTAMQGAIGDSGAGRERTDRALPRGMHGAYMIGNQIYNGQARLFGAFPV